MKIAVLSDFHFGYGYNTVLENDSFDNFKEAIEKALDSDLILIAGDIFDTKFPKTPIWSSAIRLLVKPMIQENSGVKLISCSKELSEISKRTLNHVPIVALHGNHEFRGRTTNTLETLENAGLLIHLHKDSVVFEKDGTKIAIHGMSWVPDRYAKKELKEWNPSPVPGCVNLIMFHQSISPFVYSPLEAPSLSEQDLPNGFDIIIDGHLHNPGKENIGGIPLLFPGSTVITQFDKAESRNKKGFYEIIIEDDGKFDINFVPLETTRPFFFEDVDINGDLRENIETKLDEVLDESDNGKNPLVKLKIKGKDSEYLEKEIKAIEQKYENRAILRFVKELESEKMKEKVEFLRNMRDQKLSAQEMGLKLLHKNLDELGFNSTFRVDDVFSLLMEGRLDDTLEKISNKDIAGDVVDK